MPKPKKLTLKKVAERTGEPIARVRNAARTDKGSGLRHLESVVEEDTYGRDARFVTEKEADRWHGEKDGNNA